MSKTSELKTLLGHDHPGECEKFISDFSTYEFAAMIKSVIWDQYNLTPSIDVTDSSITIDGELMFLHLRNGRYKVHMAGEKRWVPLSGMNGTRLTEGCEPEKVIKFCLAKLADRALELWLQKNYYAGG